VPGFFCALTLLCPYFFWHSCCAHIPLFAYRLPCCAFIFYILTLLWPQKNFSHLPCYALIFFALPAVSIFRFSLTTYFAMPSNFFCASCCAHIPLSLLPLTLLGADFSAHLPCYAQIFLRTPAVSLFFYALTLLCAYVLVFAYLADPFSFLRAPAEPLFSLTLLCTYFSSHLPCCALPLFAYHLPCCALFFFRTYSAVHLSAFHCALIFFALREEK